MIARFPKYSKLQLIHKADVKALTAGFEPASDFNFTSLFCWNDGSSEISIINNNLVIKLSDYTSGDPILSMLGDNQVDESLITILNEVDQLKLVPETTVKNIAKMHTFSVSEDRDNFDYIYNTADIANLAGQSFKKKRNKVNSVINTHSSRLKVVQLDHIDRTVKLEVKRLFKLWSDHVSVKSSTVTKDEIANEAEQEALENLLNHADSFDLLVTLIYLDGDLVAFSLNEIINPTYAICHFEKALPIHNQIHSLIANKAAKDIENHGCIFLNWEQDLGLPGLRRAKLSYNPHHFIRKYNVSIA